MVDTGQPSKRSTASSSSGSSSSRGLNTAAEQPQSLQSKKEKSTEKSWHIFPRKHQRIPPRKKEIASKNSGQESSCRDWASLHLHLGAILQNCCSISGCLVRCAIRACSIIPAFLHTGSDVSSLPGPRSGWLQIIFLMHICLQVGSVPWRPRCIPLRQAVSAAAISSASLPVQHRRGTPSFRRQVGKDF